MNYIFSPHIDDAFLCMGGHILNHHRQDPFKVINIFTRTNSTTRNNISNETYPRDEVVVTELRKQEEISLASRVGYEFECWDFLDRPLREAYSSEDHARMEAEITERIMSCIDKSDTLFFPLGIMHIDHITVNRIGLALWRKGYRIRFYEDMPYIVWDTLPMDERFVALTNLGLTPVCETIDIKRKIALLRNYGSQIRQDWFDSLRAFAYNPYDNAYVERYWKT